MVLTPDFTRLVAIGMRSPFPVDPRAEGEAATAGTNGGAPASNPPPKEEHRLLVYNMASRRNESCVLYCQSGIGTLIFFKTQFHHV